MDGGELTSRAAPASEKLTVPGYLLAEQVQPVRFPLAGPAQLVNFSLTTAARLENLFTSRSAPASLFLTSEFILSLKRQP